MRVEEQLPYASQYDRAPCPSSAGRIGNVRPASRVLAYIVSALLFTLMHNWQYFGLHPFVSILLSCLPSRPASVALAWVYEKGGTIWAPITLHALINAMSFGLLTLS